MTAKEIRALMAERDKGRKGVIQKPKSALKSLKTASVLLMGFGLSGKGG